MLLHFLSVAYKINLKSQLKWVGYFKRNKRFTKGRLALSTSAPPLKERLRFLDFLVSRWLLKAFAKAIWPVPVTLNVFFALECVFTLGILLAFYCDSNPPYPGVASETNWLVIRASNNGISWKFGRQR